jgi:thiosulfate/3-mercaptopyruvate sulfurtransferase
MLIQNLKIAVLSCSLRCLQARLERSSEEMPMAIDRHPESLVSTAWLADHLEDPDLRIYECTTHLRPAEPDDGVPYHPEAGFEEHGLGHIPGAGFLDLPGALSRQDAAVHFMMLPAKEFAEAVGRQGIGDGTRVVLYSRGPAMWATRAWWMLHVMGFEAAVLDGGFEKWLADGHPQSTLPCDYPPATFTPRPLPAMVAKEAVLGAISDPATCLINTLSVADFRGEEPSRYGRPAGSRAASTCPGPSSPIPRAAASSRSTRRKPSSRRSARTTRSG